MRYPDFLKQNGTIGFIAPSFGATIEPYTSAFAEGCRVLKGKGYSLVEGPNCHAVCGIGKSNTAEACAAEINDFFTHEKCDVIISCGGGETMCEDLSYVDFEAIAQSTPKWYLGYSDNTNLTFTLPTICDIAAIYGPNAPEFGMKPWHRSILDTYEVLTGQRLAVSDYGGWESESLKSEENPLAPYNITEPFDMKLYQGTGATFEGRLIGGCLDCLANLVGTRFDKVKSFNERYKEDGIVWFLECCDLNPMSYRRAIWQLDEAGWFEHASGFLLGRPMHIGEECMGMDMINAATGILGKYGLPIVMDLDIGHIHPQMPVISGAYAKIKAEDGSFNMTYILK